MKQIFNFDEIRGFLKDRKNEMGLTDEFLKLACFSLAQQIFDARWVREVKETADEFSWRSSGRGVIVNKEGVKIFVYDNAQVETWGNLLETFL